MKKVLAILCILCLSFSVANVGADYVRDLTLGSPIVNVDDTAVLENYPGIIQKFPNAFYANFDWNYTSTWNYAYFGMLYKFSDLAALEITYENRPFGFIGETVSFFNNNGTFNTSRDLYPAVNVKYGLKLGSLYAGAASKTFLYNNNVLETTSINTNSVEYAWSGISGFITELTPSASLALGNMELFASLRAKLNMTELYTTTTNKDKYYTSRSPNMFEETGVRALATMPMNDNILLGLEVQVGMEDDGFQSSQIQASTNVYKTNDWVGGAFQAAVGLGARIKATETATFFVDLETGYRTVTEVHKKDWDGQNYEIDNFFLLPSLSLAAEFEIVKNLQFRISANPMYIVNTTALADYANLAADDTSTTSVTGFMLTSSIGLGYKIGAFTINWELNGNLIDEAFNNPLMLIELNGYNNGNQYLGSQVQVTYQF